MTIDLLGAYWTTAGPVEHGARDWSLFDWPDRCAEAARAGMRGLGIWHTDLAHQLESRTLADIGRIFTDSGLEHLELEFLGDWFVGPDDPLRPAADAGRTLLFDAAAVLPVHHIKVGNLKATPVELDRLVESFAALCADAAEHHDVPLTYELMPFDVPASTLERVLQVVDAAGPNGGIALDTWHLGKMGTAPAELGAIPPERMLYVELSDGPLANLPDLSHETTRHRRLPGDGEFDIPGYVRAVAALGYRGPWGVEVLSDALRALPMAEMYRRTVETSTSQVEKGITT